jgi:hypothetical protein
MLLVALPARAQSTSDIALAESLFRDGRRMMDAGDYAAACPKLAESQRLDPGGGTLVALALCHEKLGRTATAWAEYREALADARRDRRQDRQRVAEAAIERLETRVPKVVIDVATRPPGLVVQLDGVTIGEAAFGVASPVDPGPHAFEATAPGYATWRQSLVVPEGPSLQRLTVGLVPVAREAEKSPSRASVSSWQSAVGWAAVGLGGVTLLAGSYFGYRAFTEWDDVTRRCDPARCTDPEAANAAARARTAATLANVLIPVGVVAAGVGAVLLLLSPSGAAQRAASRVH